MALVLADRVRETTTTVGTGSVTLAGALTGYQTFFAAVGNSNTTYYVIAGQGTSEWEVGVGTYTSAGNTLARTTVLSSSNAGSLVNFSAGTKDVWVDYAAGKAVTTDTLAYPPAIGGTTPAAGTFTTLTATGQTSLGGAAGSESLRVLTRTSANAYIQAQGGVSGSTRANIGLVSGTGGQALNIFNGTSGPIVFSSTFSADTVTEQFRVSHTASAVNYVQVTGAATGGTPAISAQGSDTNIPLALDSKGSSSVFLRAGGLTAFATLRTVSSVNYVTARGSVAGNPVELGAAGSDTNIDLNLTPKGTGGLTSTINSGSFTVTRNSGTNTMKVTAANTQNLALQATGGGAVYLRTGDDALTQFVAQHNGSAVNYLQATGSATGSGVTLSAQGSDTNIDINLVPKGTGTTVYTGGVTINGTLTAQNEVLNGSGQNFCLYSEQFDNAYYVKYQLSVTPNSTTSPTGTTTADTLVEDSSTNEHGLYRNSIVASGFTSYVLSVYAKAAGRNFLVISLKNAGTDNRTWFNVSTGVVGTNAAGNTATITDVGNGWYRCSVARTFLGSESAGLTYALSNADNVLSYAGNGTSGVYLWGSQLVASNAIQPYVQTTASVVYGVPSVSFTGNGSIGQQSDGSLYVSPAGNGALQAQATTSTATGGNARGALSVDWQMARDTAAKVASGPSSVVGGGQRNAATQSGAFTGGGWANVNNGYEGVIVGGSTNGNGGLQSFIGGGANNSTSSQYATMVGGYANSASGIFNFIGGGQSNSGTSAATATTQSSTMNGTTAVTLSGSNANIKVGQYITGTYIAGLTYVAAVSGTSLTLSTAATGSGTATLSFYTPHGVVVGGGNNQATGSYSFIGGGGDAGTAANRNVASGDWSVVSGGAKNLASGVGSFVGGGGFYGSGFAGNTASGGGASVVGGFGNFSGGYASFVGGGDTNSANSFASSILGGRNGTTRSIVGASAFPACYQPVANAPGISQAGLLLLGRQTTDATATVLCSDTSPAGTTNQLILPNNAAYHFKGSVIANVTGAANGAAWEFSGAIMRGANAASTVLINTPSINRIAASSGATAWTIALTADTTNGGLAVTVTGAASTTIRWVCSVNTTEVTF